MKHANKLLVVLIAILTAPCAIAETVEVDGVGGGSTYATLSDAYAAINHNDGQADVINVTTNLLTEDTQIQFNQNGGFPDDLTINGDAEGGTGDGTPCTIISTVANNLFYCWYITDNTTIIFNDLVLAYDYSAGDLSAAAIRFRQRDGLTISNMSYTFNNVTITATKSGNVLATSAEAHDAANMTTFLRCVDFSAQPLSTTIDNALNFNNCTFMHAEEHLLDLGDVTSSLTINIDSSLITRGDANRIGILLDNNATADCVVNVSNTEISHLSGEAIFVGGTSSRATVHLLEGTEIRDIANGEVVEIRAQSDTIGFSTQGTEANPVLIGENCTGSALVINNLVAGTVVDYGPFEHTVFTAPTSAECFYPVWDTTAPAVGSAIGPFNECLFINGNRNIRFRCSGIAFDFEACTFHNANADYSNISEASGSGDNVITFTDCVFTGNGSNSTRVHRNDSGDTIAYQNSALVREGPYAFANNPPYSGSNITETATVNSDPLYVSTAVFPLTADSFDVDNPNYGGAATGGANLSGFGDYIGAAISEVIVDGNPDSPPNYQTLANAYAALDRNDGIPDVVQMLVETESISGQFNPTGSDPITLNGDANNNGACALIQTADSYGIYLQPDATATGVWTFRDLVILPDFNRNGLESFGRAAIYYRPNTSGGNSNWSAVFEDVTITATADAANTPVDVTSPYSASHVHWGTGIQVHNGDYTGLTLSNVSLDLTRMDLAHAYDYGLYLRFNAAADAVDFNLDDCRLLNLRSGRWNIDAQTAGGYSLTLTDTEVAHGAGAIFANDILAAGVDINILEGCLLRDAESNAAQLRASALNGPLSFIVDGTATKPVVLRDNAQALLVDQAPSGSGSLAFGPMDNAIFEGNGPAFGSGIRVNTGGNAQLAGSSFGPFSHLLFADNEEHMRFNCQDVTAQFTDITFHAPRSVYHVYTEGGDGSNNLSFTDCVFTGAGSGATRGIRDNNGDTIALQNCALPTYGPYAHEWDPPYAGTNISSTNSIVGAGPMYADVTVPVVATSFDVRNPAYATADSGGAALTGWGDFAAGSVLPTVALDSPSDGASFTEGDGINLTATASDDSAVDRVEFFDGSSLLDTDSASPYEAGIASAAAGNYALSAIAYDDTGLYARSAVANISVLAFADVVTVDGVGASPDTYATIAAAYAALPRSNGIQDYINVTTDTLTESVRTDIVSGADPIYLFGDADGNGQACQVVQSTAGEGAFFLWPGDEANSVTLRDLVLLPNFVSGSDHSRWPFEIRARDNASDTQVRMENITVTAVRSGNVPVAASEAWEDASAGSVTHWFRAISLGYTASGTSNVDFEFVGCSFIHSGDDMLVLRAQFDSEFLFDNCLLAKSGGNLVDIQDADNQRVVLRDTELTDAGVYAIYYRDGAAPNSELVIEQGSYIHNNYRDGRPAINVYQDGDATLALSMIGTPANPVRIENNASYGLWMERLSTGTQVALGPFQDVLLTSNTNAAVGFNDSTVGEPLAGSYIGPFDHCLFARNGESNGQILWASNDLVSTFTDCTFVDPVGVYQQYNRWGGGNTLTYIDCVFAGLDKRGANYVVDNDDTITYDHCALVTAGDDAMLYRFYNGATNQPSGPASVTEISSLTGGPLFLSKTNTPVEEASYDVQNRAYGGQASNGGPLSGWGDYAPPTTAEAWWSRMD